MGQKPTLTLVPGRLLLQAQQLAAMDRPTSPEGKSLQHFMENGFEVNGIRVRPLLQADTKHVYQTEDLVTLRPGRERAWLDEFVVHILKMIYCKPLQVSRQQVLRRSVGH